MRQPYSNSREIIRRAFATRNLSKGSIDILISSLSSATLRQYNVPLKAWWIFVNKTYDPFSTTPNIIMEFLLEKYNKGDSYGTLNTARSAISLIVPEDISNNVIIRRFFKGIFKLRPTKPKYTQTWNTDSVLDFISKLSPLETLSLKQLSEKLIILLALVTAHRVQTFSLINLDNIANTPSGVHIKIPDLIKTSAPGRYQPLLVLPYFFERPELCVAKTLQFYLSYTEKLKNTNRLFITLNKPHKAVTSQTLSRWIKSVFLACGLDLQQFTAHSTRHAATSAAYLKGVPIDIIRQTAGWTKNSQVFSKFYNKPIMSKSDTFASAVLQRNSGHS